MTTHTLCNTDMFVQWKFCHISRTGKAVWPPMDGELSLSSQFHHPLQCRWWQLAVRTYICPILRCIYCIAGEVLWMFFCELLQSPFVGWEASWVGHTYWYIAWWNSMCKSTSLSTKTQNLQSYSCMKYSMWSGCGRMGLWYRYKQVSLTDTWDSIYVLSSCLTDIHA